MTVVTGVNAVLLDHLRLSSQTVWPAPELHRNFVDFCRFGLQILHASVKHLRFPCFPVCWPIVQQKLFADLQDLSLYSCLTANIAALPGVCNTVFCL